MIVIDKVTKKYGHKKVLDEVSFKVDGGEFLCIVGPSGAGKSTLIHALIGATKINDGEILIDDFSIGRMRAGGVQAFRRMIGIVFQDYKLLPKKTVFENVAFALEVCGYEHDFIQKQVTAALKLTGLEDLRNNYPHQLSGGESQRTAIARALVHDPDLFIADEPTGNLDPENTETLIDLFKKINKNGTTVIIATHNKNIVDRAAKRIISLEKGRVVHDKKVNE